MKLTRSSSRRLRRSQAGTQGRWILRVMSVKGMPQNSFGRMTAPDRAYPTPATRNGGYAVPSLG